MQLIADSARVDGKLSGFQVIGEDCTVGAGASLEDSVLLPGTEIAPGSVIKNQVLT